MATSEQLTHDLGLCEDIAAGLQDPLTGADEGGDAILRVVEWVSKHRAATEPVPAGELAEAIVQCDSFLAYLVKDWERAGNGRGMPVVGPKVIEAIRTVLPGSRETVSPDEGEQP